jgi:hypothetical protein
MRPTIRLPRTREIRDREERFKVTRIVEMLTLKIDKMPSWDCDEKVWHTTFDAGGRHYGVKIDTVVVRNGPEDTPHKLRLQGYGFDHGGRFDWWKNPWPPADFELVGHPSLRELQVAVEERYNVVGRLIDSMIAELNNMGAPA